MVSGSDFGRKTMKRLLFGLCAMLTVSAPAAAQNYNMSLAGASPGGLWSLLGAGIDSAVKAEYPNSTITYQTSGGGIANVALVERKQAEMAIIHDAELKIANEGRDPFKEPIRSLRGIAYLYDWAPFHMIVTKSFADQYNLESIADIAKSKAPVRMVINKRGNIASDIGVEMMETVGAGPDKIQEWGGAVIYAASGEQAEMLMNRRIDMINNSLFVGHSSIRQIDDALDMTLLSIPDDVIAKMSDQAGVKPYTIPDSAYGDLEEPVQTVTLGAALVVHEDMSEEDAYNLTKALYENHDKLRDVHKAMKELTSEMMASLDVIPFHPGAERYLREAGLLKTN